MLWYDKIYEYYINTTNALFTKTYSITDISWKYYIAIMAVSTIKSEYMLSFLENEFLLSGGELSWIIEGIKGNEGVHKKLKQLANINNIIAHQPWKLQVKDIKDLLTYWTKEELLDALFIIVHFQRQASLIESLKVELKETDIETEQLSDLLYSKYTKNENNLYECLEELNLEEDETEDNFNNEEEENNSSNKEKKINKLQQEVINKELKEVKSKELEENKEDGGRNINKNSNSNINSSNNNSNSTNKLKDSNSNNSNILNINKNNLDFNSDKDLNKLPRTSRSK